MFTWNKRPKNQILAVENWAKLLHLRNGVRPEEVRNRMECILRENSLQQLQILSGLIFKIQKCRTVPIVNKHMYLF